MIMKLYSENKVSADFSNLTAHILFDNVLHEENIAIRNIWQKGDNCYFNVYFSSSGKTRVLDAHYIYDIFDHDSGRYYKDINLFIRDYVQRSGEEKHLPPTPRQENKIEQNYYLLREIAPEIVILAFFATLSLTLSDVKQRVVFDFVRRFLSSNADISSTYVEAYIKTLRLDEDAFYHALSQLNAKASERLKELASDAAKISAADGVIHYQEKLFLAELLQHLRTLNIVPDFEL